MKKYLTKRNILVFIIVFLGFAQMFRIDKSNPVVQSDQDFLATMNPPTKVFNMIKGQCYDCHSNESKYPWYTNYAPVSWWIKSNINGAREELNFSTWSLLSKEKKIAKIQDCIEALEEGEMPVGAYVAMHEEAQFSDEDGKTLLAWFKALNIE